MTFEEWNTPGWTAQNPHTEITSDNVYPDPPEGLVYLPITASFTANGKGQQGVLHFIPSVPYVTTSSGRVSLTAQTVQVTHGTLPSGFALLQPDISSEVIPDQWNWQVSGRIGKDAFDLTINTPYPADSFDITTQNLIGVRTMPATYNIPELYSGDTFDLTVTLRDTSYNSESQSYERTPVDLTGCVVTAQVRETPLAANIITEFVTTIIEPATDGEIYLFLDSESTGQFRGFTTLYYDVQVTRSDGWVHTYLKGTIQVDPDVTKP